MFSTQLQLKFASVSEAKIAAQSLCDLLKGRITIFDFHGLHVTIGKEGELAVNVRFEDVAAMAHFERNFQPFSKTSTRPSSSSRAVSPASACLL